MTKGRAVLIARVVAEQEPFFITLGGRKAHRRFWVKYFSLKSRAADSLVDVANEAVPKGRHSL
jgi:hypothetical protein